jgi:leader peptidase (prepilin peptidase)/N-methyltransferase
MSDAVLLPLLALFGLVVGSFVNVVIVRVPSGESLVRPGSQCPLCEHPIAPRDNIPVLSWLLLRGRCRSCHEPIPVGYPLVEVANAVLWVAAGLRFGASWPLVPYALVFSVLLALSVIDLELYLLPNRIVYPAVVASLVAIVPLSLLVDDDPLGRILGAVAGGVGYFLLLGLFLLAFELVMRKEGMGAGDVKLAALLGVWVGWIDPVLVFHALLAGAVLGLVVGAVVLAVRRSNRPYPFGPWLVLGALLVILASSPILERLEAGDPASARGSSGQEVGR